MCISLYTPNLKTENNENFFVENDTFSNSFFVQSISHFFLWVEW